MMGIDDVKNWIWVVSTICIWLISASVIWTRLTDRINGIGKRVKDNGDVVNSTVGKVERMERELDGYRRDIQDTSSHVSRVEKAVENVSEAVREGNTTIGVQLHELEKLITEKDTRTQIRLTRMEVVAGIEAKIGPLPEE